MKPVLYGPAYSVYVRIVKIVLAEKDVDHDRVEFDVFDRNDWPAGWLERQPFGLVPAFEHNGFRLYETRPITPYVDEARSEEGRGGTEGVRTCRSRWSAYI